MCPIPACSISIQENVHLKYCKAILLLYPYHVQCTLQAVSLSGYSYSILHNFSLPPLRYTSALLEFLNCIPLSVFNCLNLCTKTESNMVCETVFFLFLHKQTCAQTPDIDCCIRAPVVIGSVFMRRFRLFLTSCGVALYDLCRISILKNNFMLIYLTFVEFQHGKLPSRSRYIVIFKILTWYLPSS